MRLMAAEKSIKASISMPKSYYAAVDAQAEGRKLSRSGWIQDAVSNALRAAGAFPDDPVTIEIQRLRELVALRGVEAVHAKLDELANGAVEAEPALAGGGR